MHKVKSVLNSIRNDSLINEMPYLFDLDLYSIPNDGKHIDLQLEGLSGERQLITFIKTLIKNNTFTDKYGNSIYLNNQKDIISFMRAIMSSPSVLYKIGEVLNPEREYNLSSLRRKIREIFSKVLSHNTDYEN